MQFVQLLSREVKIRSAKAGVPSLMTLEIGRCLLHLFRYLRSLRLPSPMARSDLLRSKIPKLNRQEILLRAITEPMRVSHERYYAYSCSRNSHGKVQKESCGLHQIWCIDKSNMPTHPMSKAHLKSVHLGYEPTVPL